MIIAIRFFIFDALMIFDAHSSLSVKIITNIVKDHEGRFSAINIAYQLVKYGGTVLKHLIKLPFIFTRATATTYCPKPLFRKLPAVDCYPKNHFHFDPSDVLFHN